MSMTGEITLSTYEETFAEITEGFDEKAADEGLLAVDGLGSVMVRARRNAQELVDMSSAGISDVNAEAAAFQSAR